MEIEMAVFASKDEDIEEDEELLESMKEILDSPINEANVRVDDVISRKQQKRLSKLFTVSDKGHKGYLTTEELNHLLGKLHSIIPHANILKLAKGAEDDKPITFPQFLTIFAVAKGSQQSIFAETEKTIPERIGTSLLQAISKSQSVKKISRAAKRNHQDSSIVENDYDYEEFSDGNRITLVNNREHRKLVWTKAGAIFRAALIGSFWTTISGLVEFIVGRQWGYTGDITEIDAPVSHVVWFWTVVVLVNIVATILEILCLYLDSLRAASLIAGYIGLDPWVMGYVSDMDHAATAIVRAAFELPHPSKQILGIRPLRYSNRFNVFLKAVLWKSKRGLTALLIGSFLKKLISRATMKIATPFIAVPVAAVWNSFVAWKVVCDIYSIVIGNIAIASVITKVVEPKYQELSATAKDLVYCVSGVAIALEQQIHPILETLLRLVCRHWGDPPPYLPLDDKYFLQNQLVECPREEQLLILQLLAVAIVSIYNISIQSLRFLEAVVIACGLNPDQKGIDELRVQLSSKPYIDVDHITDLFRDSVMKDHSRSWWARLAIWAKVISYNIAY